MTKKTHSYQQSERHRKEQPELKKQARCVRLRRLCGKTCLVRGILVSRHTVRDMFVSSNTVRYFSTPSKHYGNNRSKTKLTEGAAQNQTLQAKVKKRHRLSVSSGTVRDFSIPSKHYGNNPSKTKLTEGIAQNQTLQA